MAYKEKEVLNNVDLTIQDGEFFVLIGSSGCGKTTLLKSINKLLPVQQGTLKINGTPVSQIKVNQLPNLVGYVVQAGGLFPHLTVEENIALVMKVAQYPKEQIHDRVTAMLKMVNLDPALYRNQYPAVRRTAAACGGGPGLCGGPAHRPHGRTLLGPGPHDPVRAAE